uniref:TBC1 domain family member 22B n=1 Tax=Lepisosteus oculatus TaxID=7918 RepID=W5MYX1_LEPOC
MTTDNKIQFWKRNTKVPGSIQPVYGAQHPPLDPRIHKTFLKDGPKTNALSIKSKKASSFHEFARSTSDAWDIGDDEDGTLSHVCRYVSMSCKGEIGLLENKYTTKTNRGQQKGKKKNQRAKGRKSGGTGRQGVKQEVGEDERDEKIQTGIEQCPSECKACLIHSKCSAHKEAEWLPPVGSWRNVLIRNTLHKQQSLPLRPIIPLIARISDQNASGAPPMTVREKSRLEKFRQLLASPNTDLEELRKHSWSGIPREVRPITWRLLSGYLPANMERRELVLRRKREEYFGFIQQYYDSRNDEHHRDTYRQLDADISTLGISCHVLECEVTHIHIDIPRTNPLIPLFQQASVQEVFERILFIWAIRHPASGYVQGINDLVTPFFVVFLSEFVEEDVENFDVSALPLDTQRNIEADSFWCMSKLLDGIQDNYTFAQPGIQIKVKALEELVSRIDEDVHNHFSKYEVEYLQFAFRWMNNLLMRELPLRCTIRLWDTYQAEAEGFSHFHLYVCAAFLIKWRKEILSMVDFQGLLMLLQNLPTIHWGNEEVGLLLAEAYRLKYMFADAPNHYRR